MLKLYKFELLYTTQNAIFILFKTSKQKSCLITDPLKYETITCSMISKQFIADLFSSKLHDKSWFYGITV